MDVVLTDRVPPAMPCMRDTLCQRSRGIACCAICWTSDTVLGRHAPSPSRRPPALDTPHSTPRPPAAAGRPARWRSDQPAAARRCGSKPWTTRVMHCKRRKCKERLLPPMAVSAGSRQCNQHAQRDAKSDNRRLGLGHALGGCRTPAARSAVLAADTPRSVGLCTVNADSPMRERSRALARVGATGQIR